MLIHPQIIVLYLEEQLPVSWHCRSMPSNRDVLIGTKKKKAERKEKAQLELFSYWTLTIGRLKFSPIPWQSTLTFGMRIVPKRCVPLSHPATRFPRSPHPQVRGNFLWIFEHPPWFHGPRRPQEARARVSWAERPGVWVGKRLSQRPHHPPPMLFFASRRAVLTPCSRPPNCTLHRFCSQGVSGKQTAPKLLFTLIWREEVQTLSRSCILVIHRIIG